MVVLRTGYLPYSSASYERCCHEERSRSFSARSGWTPEVCCSCTSQDGALRSACRIAWTAIAGAPGRRTGLLPGRSQEPARLTSAGVYRWKPSPAFPLCHKHVFLLSRLPFGSLRSALTAHMFMPRSSWLETASRRSLSRKGGVCHEDIQGPCACACGISHRGQR